ncbi:MAG: hypothetical protein ACXAEU_14445 [Candidatus Hodarchaeales archaeon]|jgi:hypothetical protein
MLNLAKSVNLEKTDVTIIMEEENISSKEMRTMLTLASKVLNGASNPDEILKDSIEKYGIDGTTDLLVSLASPKRSSFLLQDFQYNRVTKTHGWTRLKNNREDGLYDTGILVAIDGTRQKGTLIGDSTRACFDIISAAQYKPSKDDEVEPPPYGWRIGMFEGDKKYRMKITPILQVAGEMNINVRDIKDSVDFSLLQAAIRNTPGWNDLGPFPEIGAPSTVQQIKNGNIKRRLTVGLSAAGFPLSGSISLDEFTSIREWLDD